jgi:hypothetical protein
MKSLLTKIAVGAAGLVLAAAPLAASAQSWHGHDNGNRDRGGYVQRGGNDRDDRYRDRDDRYRVGYARPVYQQPYVDGYFGWAPGGFQGYYWNGGWYHNRRWSGGVWIYF